MLSYSQPVTIAKLAKSTQLVLARAFDEKDCGFVCANYWQIVLRVSQSDCHHPSGSTYFVRFWLLAGLYWQINDERQPGIACGIRDQRN